MEINKEEVKNRFGRSADSYNEHAKVQKMVVEQLHRMILESIDYAPEKILEVGCGTGLLTMELKHLFPTSDLYINDLSHALCQRAALHSDVATERVLSGDIEEIDLPGVFDAIFSASTFQWLAEPQNTFARLSRHLRQKGLMIFSTYGKYNLREIRMTTGGGLDYRSQDEIMELLEPYFRVEQIREEFRLLEFADPIAILQHLKKTGVNLSCNPVVWTKGTVEAFTQEYNRRFAMDGKVTLTYHPLYLICRKK